MSPAIKPEYPPFRQAACQMGFHRFKADLWNPLQTRRWRLVYALGITVGQWLAWFLAAWTGDSWTVCEWEHNSKTGTWKFRLLRRIR